MSGPTAIERLLEAWGGRLTVNEAVDLGALHDQIAEAIRRAQKVPASIDRRCMALVVTKLEEAEHWALEARRIAADRPAPVTREHWEGSRDD
jgi:hypothetical protein